MLSGINNIQINNEDLTSIDDAFFSNIVNNSNDGIAIYDSKMNLIFCNPAHHNILGYSKLEFTGIDHKKLSLYHPNDIETIKKTFRNVLNGSAESIDKRIICKTGDIKHFSSSLSPIIINSEKAVLVFRREITKKKNADIYNAEYLEFLETFIDNIPVPIYAKSFHDRRYMFWNKSTENTFALSSDDVIGYTDKEICLPKEYLVNSENDDNALLNGKQYVRSEVEFTNNNGIKKNFINFKSIIKLPVGECLILGAGIDVSDLRTAQNKIEQSGYIIKEAQKIAKLGYWEYDIRRDIIIDNKENRQIFEIDENSNFLNLNDFFSLLHPNSKDDFRRSIELCKSGKKECELIVRNNNYNSKYIIINFKPCVDNYDEVIKIKGTAIDITRLKRTELTIQEFETKLRQAENIAKTGYWDINYITNSTQLSSEVWNVMCCSQIQNNYSIADISHRIHPNDKELFNNLFNNNETQFESSFRVISPDDSIKYIKAQGTNVLNPIKEIIRSIGIFTDITGLIVKDIQNERLSMSLQNIVKHSGLVYIEESNDTGIYFSNNFNDILECDELILKSQNDFNNFIDSKDRDNVIQNINESFNKCCKHEFTYIISLPNGKAKRVTEVCNTYINSITQNKTTLRIMKCG